MPFETQMNGQGWSAKISGSERRQRKKVDLGDGRIEK